MNGVQTRFKCKLDVKRCKRFVFPPSSLLPRSNALKTKAIRYFQTDRTLTRIVSPPLNVYMQLVTYSGHAPFKLPEELKEIHFSPAIPQKMNDYMTTARYTDKAIGKFVEYLKTLPQYDETLIVITGDHEGLATYREELCNAPGGKGIVSDKTFTPFIIVNSPVGMRYDKVMGQIDMYPTLLNLLQLDDYYWSGLGQSILDPCKKGFAISPQMEVVGEEPTPAEAEFAKKAYDISDQMIHFDYLCSKAKIGGTSK